MKPSHHDYNNAIQLRLIVDEGHTVSNHCAIIFVQHLPDRAPPNPHD